MHRILLKNNFNIFQKNVLTNRRASAIIISTTNKALTSKHQHPIFNEGDEKSSLEEWKKEHQKNMNFIR